MVKKPPGSIKIQAKELKADYGRMQAVFNIKSKDFAHVKTPHFIVISRRNKQDWIPIIKTETKMIGKDKFFAWNTIIVDTDTLCDNDYN